MIVWNMPPTIDAEGRVIPVRCQGAFYLGAGGIHEVTDLSELAAIYGGKLEGVK